MVLFYLQIQDDFWKRQIIFDKMRRIFRGRLSRSRSKGGIIGKIRFSSINQFFGYLLCLHLIFACWIPKVKQFMIQIIYKFQSKAITFRSDVTNQKVNKQVSDIPFNVSETAFVSQTQSSTEDLDEVDRLANHPVLRPSSSRSQWHRLRKSRSETGGSVDRGLAPWTMGSGESNQSSPMAAASSTANASSSGFGSRLVQAALLKKRSKKPISKMKRSYTVDFAAAQAEDSPQSLQKPRYDGNKIALVKL